MKFADSKQIRIIHAALATKGLVEDKEYKKGQVKLFSNGRAESTKDLYYDEANDFIAALNGKPALLTPKDGKRQPTGSVGSRPKDEIREKKLKAVFSMMHRLKWYTDETINTALPKLDYKRLNEWLTKYGHWHKSLDGHKTDELSVVIFQLGQVLKGNLKEV